MESYCQTWLKFVSFDNSEFPKVLILTPQTYPLILMHLLIQTKCLRTKYCSFFKLLPHFDMKHTSIFSFCFKYYKTMNMKVSSYSHRNTFFDSRYWEVGLFSCFVFLFEWKNVSNMANFTEIFSWQEVNIFKITMWFLSLTSESLRNIHERSLVLV